MGEQYLSSVLSISAKRTNMNETSKTAGGRATEAGMAFQATVATWFAAQMLADMPIGTAFGLPADSRIAELQCETGDALDDVVARLTDGGTIYVQCKTRPGLTVGPDSLLAGALAQLANLYARGGLPAPGNAPAVALLAVSEAAPRSLDTLEAACRMFDHGGSWDAVMAQLPDDRRAALELFETHVRAAWEGVAKTTLASNDLVAMARLFRIRRFPETPAANEWRSAAQLLGRRLYGGDEAGEAPMAYLLAFTRRAIQTGAPADRHGLLRSLRAAGHIDVAAPAYDHDINALLAYSGEERQRLKKHTVLPLDGAAPIPRDCLQPLMAATTGGSLLVTGEPGAGKTGVLLQLADLLEAQPGPVLFLSVERFSGFTKRSDFRDELQLQHDPVEILAAWPGDAPGVLIIDALDASRGGASEPVIAAFISDAVERVGTRWSVVASIRSFDLRNGRRFREIMRGAPPEQRFAEPLLNDVRHFHVAQLSPNELGAVAAGSPKLRDLEATAPPKVRNLLRNIFNLSLAAELLEANVEPTAIQRLATQSELIGKYEDIRLTDQAMRRAAKAAVTLMVLRRRLTVRDVDVESDAVDAVCKAGVLVPAGGDNIAFAHHVLFDHIAGRFYLDADDPKELHRQLSGDPTIGLVLGPALRFALERMWQADTTGRPRTWRFLTELAAEVEPDPIVLSIALRTAAEQVEGPADVAGLRTLLERSTDLDAIGKLLGQVARFVGMAADQTPTQSLPAAVAEAWAAIAQLAAGLSDPRAADAARILLMTLAERADLGEVAVGAAFGTAARALLATAWSSETAHPVLATAAIRFVTRSYGSNPEASRSLLERMLGDRFEAHASAEAPWLAEGVPAIVPHDPAFVVRIYETLFLRDVTDEGKTWMGGSASRILPLSSTHRQDYQHARWRLNKALGPFLTANPVAGTSAVIRAVRGLDTERRDRRRQTAPAPMELQFDGRTVRLIDDLLSLQDWREDDARDVEPLITFVEFLRACPPEVFRSVVEVVTAETANTAVWARILGVASERLGVADDLLWPLVSEPRFLALQGVARDAIIFVAAAYSTLTVERRTTFEAGLLTSELFPDERDTRWWRAVLGRFLSAVPEPQLATEGMRALRTEMDAAGDLTGNRPFVTMSVGRSERENVVDGILQSGGADLERIPDREIRAASRLVENDVKHVGEDSDTAALAGLWAHIIGLVQVLDESGDKHPHPQLLHSSWGAVCNGVERLAKSTGYDPTVDGLPDLDMLLALIDRLAVSPYPEVVETPSNDMAWGNWDVRVYAATSVVALVPRFGDARPDLVERLASCLDDPVPTVRLQVAQALNVLWNVAHDRMWDLVTKVAERETNEGVLTFFIAGTLWPMGHEYPERVAQLLSRLLGREWATADEAEPTGRDRDAEASANLMTFLFVTHDCPEAWNWIDRWAGDLRRGEAYLTPLLYSLRQVFFFAYRESPRTDELEMALRAHRLLNRVITAAAAAEIEARPHLLGSPDVETVARWRPLFVAADRVVDQVCNQLYFGSGAFRSGSDDDSLGLPTAESKRRFIADYGTILDILSAHAQAGTVHNLVELYGFLAEGDPAAVFDRVASLLLGAGVQDGYQYESLGSDSLVALIRRYLADYRDTFEDSNRRARLIAVLELFAGVGWPEALKLLFELPDLLR